MTSNPGENRSALAGGLSEAEVRKVARLARLELAESEVGEVQSRLGAVLGYVERLRELDLSGVEPLTQVSEDVNRLDDDVPGATLANEALMGMAPAVDPPFVVVPKVIGGGGA